MASKYVDSTAVIQVVGNVFNNPSLLDFTDKYTITDEDFVDEFHRITFGAIFKIHELGADKITLKNISDYLASRPKSEAIYKQNKGEEWLLKISENSMPEAFDYYYSRLKKFSLLRAYDNCGIDVSDIYDPDNILDTQKKQQQEDMLDNSSLEKIADKIDGKIENIRLKYVDDSYGEAMQAGNDIDKLLDNLKQHPEVGSPLYGPLINTVTRGARLGKFYLRSAATGSGKAIPNYTIIPTPIGNRQVGDIKVGDYLFGQDGKPTKVLAVYPQSEKKEVWKVTFSDGRVAECCGEHLWEYRYEGHRGYSYRVEDIQTIYERSLKLKNGLKDSNDRGYRFYIKLSEAVQYKEKQYKLPPYVMGAFLGDGSFRYNNTRKALSFSSIDNNIPELIIQALGDQYQYVKSSDYNYNYYFKHIDNLNHPIWVEEFLSDYPELWNVKSENKFIPIEYLQGSIQQRFELLQGLLDTDGTIDNNGRVRFTTVSPYLRDNIIELCHSLGFVTSYKVDKRVDKYTTGECYGIHIQCKKKLKPQLFKLEKKRNKAIAYANSTKREEYKDHLAIINIEKTAKKVDMTCFTVDNESHLFLMNDYIVTHNTRSMIADACYLACDEVYDSRFGWIHNGIKQPTLFIATEQDLSEVQTMMLAFLSEVNEEHILNWKFEDGEEERVRKAAEIIKSSPLYVEYLPDFSLKDIEDRIKKNIREHDVMFCFLDYIHSSMKILEEITRRSGGIKLREDNILFMLSTKLKDICNQYGIFIMSAT